MTTRIAIISVERARARATHGAAARASTWRSEDMLAEYLRGLAGRRAPCAARELRRAALEALKPLAAAREAAALEPLIRAALDALLTYGDLLEAPAAEAPDAAVVHLAPPRLVALGEGLHLLLGVAPDHAEVLSPEVRAVVEPKGSLRLVRTTAPDGWTALERSGLPVLSAAHWTRAPAAEDPEVVLAQARAQVAAAPPCGPLEDLEVLDPAKEPTYYRGRWVRPGALTGQYVGRRPVPYGAARWCFVHLDGGVAAKLVDLPVRGSAHRGCDEAFRLQAAVDAAGGRRQVVEEARSPEGASTLMFFHPVPAWAERYWTAAGEKVDAHRCLFAYRFEAAAAGRAREFAQRQLWLQVRPAQPR